MILPIQPRRQLSMYDGEILEAGLKLLQKNSTVRGEYVTDFENVFARYIGTKHAVATPSGRFALKQILENLDAPSNKCIIPAYTDESVLETIIACNYEPIFIDIFKDSFNIVPDEIEKQLKKSGPSIIIATHLFGIPCNLSKILKIAKEYNSIVIEDCAHALGSTYNDKSVGSFGEASYFSFSGTKPYHTFGGGMLTTNNDELVRKVRLFLSKLKKPKRTKLLFNISLLSLIHIASKPLPFTIGVFPSLMSLSFFDQDLIGVYSSIVKPLLKTSNHAYTNYSDLQAFIGLRMLSMLPAQIEKRRKRATVMQQILNNYTIVGESKNSTSNYYFFIIRCRDIKLKKISRALLAQGIDTGKRLMRNCGELYGEKGKFPNTIDALNTSLQVPININKPLQYAIYIAQTIKYIIEN